MNGSSASSQDSSNSEEDRKEAEKMCSKEGKCICHRPASSVPGHEWIVTKKGYEIAQEWLEQEEKRDQDNFNMYIPKKWSGYGTAEVIENIVCEVKRPP